MSWGVDYSTPFFYQAKIGKIDIMDM